jgi:hypothetical protein
MQSERGAHRTKEWVSVQQNLLDRREVLLEASTL